MNIAFFDSGLGGLLMMESVKKSLPQFCKIFQSISLQPSIDLNNQTQFSGLLLVSLAIITLFSSVTYLFLG